MELIQKPLSQPEIQQIQQKYGNYVKVTVDLEKEILVVGCELHADGEKILLDKGSQQDNIWGGGINFKSKEVDTTAVLNIRPRLDNPSIEILDQQRRNKLIEIVKKLFKDLWD